MSSRTKHRSASSTVTPLDVFNGDPWNALLVLGLRVYSKADVNVRVVKDGEGEEGDETSDGEDA